MNNPQPIETAISEDFRGSWPALLRAAKRAREVAANTCTALVVMRDGELRHIYPQPQPAADLWLEPGGQQTEPRDESS